MRIVTLAAFAVLFVGALTNAKAQTYEAKASVGELMENVVSPLNSVFGQMNRAGGPQTDEDWAKSASTAKALADVSQLLLMGGRVKDQTWTDAATALAPAAMALADASTAKNMDQWNAARQQISQACATCHEVHRPRPQRGAGARGGAGAPGQ